MDFKYGPGLITAPALSGFAITPSDSADLPGGNFTRGILVGVGGNLKVTYQDGSVDTLPNLIAGVVHALCVRRVWSTGTTATGIHGLV